MKKRFRQPSNKALNIKNSPKETMVWPRNTEGFWETQQTWNFSYNPSISYIITQTQVQQALCSISEKWPWNFLFTSFPLTLINVIYQCSWCDIPFLQSQMFYWKTLADSTYWPSLVISGVCTAMVTRYILIRLLRRMSRLLWHLITNVLRLQLKQI